MLSEGFLSVSVSSDSYWWYQRSHKGPKAKGTDTVRNTPSRPSVRLEAADPELFLTPGARSSTAHTRSQCRAQLPNFQV